MKKKLCFYTFLASLLCSGIIFSQNRGLIVVNIGYDNGGTGQLIDGITKPGDIVVRAQGAGIAGSCVIINGVSYELFYIPVGILCPDVKCYLSGGMILDAELFFNELASLQKKGIKNIKERLRVSMSVHLVMPYHRLIDDQATAAGHTRKGTILRSGIRSAAADKRFGIGIRLADLYAQDFDKLLKNAVKRANDVLVKMYQQKPLDYELLLKEYKEYAKQFAPFVRDQVELKLNLLLAQHSGPRIIFESSYGTLYDVSHGGYPYTSVECTTAAGICAQAGVGPTRIGHTLGQVNAYATMYGQGPFPTEIKDKKILKNLMTKSRTTQNQDDVRYGWLDAVMIRQEIMINGVDSIAISRLDDLDDFDEIYVCVHYKIDDKDLDYRPAISRDLAKVIPHYVKFKGWKRSLSKIKKFSELPEEARDFIKKIERICGAPVSYISVGPERSQLVEVVSNLLPENTAHNIKKIATKK